METALLSRTGRGAALRLLFSVVLIGTLTAVARPVYAGIDWCSTDPVFIFEHRGLLTSYPLDVQVMVPLSKLPLRDAAKLKVAVPSNVNGLVVNPPNPVFPVAVAVSDDAPPATSTRYKVKFGLLVPGDGFPVRLVVTDPLTLKVYVVEGTAGQTLQLPIEVGVL